MKIKTKIIMVFIVFLSGALVGYFGKAPEEIIKEKVVVEKVEDLELKKEVEELKKKLSQIANIDYLEYLRLKKDEEKFAKADELLGRIMLIFLADLGMRLDPNSRLGAERSLRNKVTDEENKANDQIDVQQNVGLVEEPLSEKRKKTVISVKEDIRDEVKKVNSLAEVEELLKKVDLKDFSSELRSASTVQAEALERIVGDFSGKIQFFSGQRKEVEVFMSLDARIEEGVAKGKSVIVLSRDGKEFSRSTGEGDQDRTYKSFADSKAGALLVKISPDRFFQLFEAQGVGDWVGNLYERKSEEFSRVGFVVLEKR